MFLKRAKGEENKGYCTTQVFFGTFSSFFNNIFCRHYTSIFVLEDTSTMSATDSNTNGLPASPLLRLPFEIRLMIYEYLLFPSTHPSTGNSTSIANLLPDFHTYYSEDTNNSPFTLSVRTIDPWLGSQGSRTWRRRSMYHVRTGKPHFLPELLSNQIQTGYIQ